MDGSPRFRNQMTGRAGSADDYDDYDANKIQNQPEDDCAAYIDGICPSENQNLLPIAPVDNSDDTTAIKDDDCRAYENGECVDTVSNMEVVNGIRAARGTVPWQALIEDMNSGEICGGSVLNKLFILTAAHCIDGHKSSRGNFEFPKNILGNEKANQIFRQITASLFIMSFDGFF